MEAWLNGAAGNNAGFSDIINALSSGRLCGVAAHGEEYWKEDETNAPMEIFVNLIYIKTVKPSEVQKTESFLEELFRVREELI